MSKDEVFQGQLLLAAAADERLRNQEDLCWLVYLNLKDEADYRPENYLDWNEGQCRKYPPAHFDAKPS